MMGVSWREVMVGDGGSLEIAFQACRAGGVVAAAPARHWEDGDRNPGILTRGCRRVLRVHGYGQVWQGEDKTNSQATNSAPLVKMTQHWITGRSIYRALSEKSIGLTADGRKLTRIFRHKFSDPAGSMIDPSLFAFIRIDSRLGKPWFDRPVEISSLGACLGKSCHS